MARHRRFPRLAILILAGGLCAGITRAGDRPNSPAKKIFVVAHAGAHREAPENTFAALDKAIQIGCDYVEMDLRRTKDGVLILMHDATVDRTTDGSGRIAELTMDEVRKLQVRHKGTGFAGQKVPTFDEILTRAKGHIKIYVDHKQAPPGEVLAAIERHGMLQDVVVYGTLPVLREYKRLAPTVWIMPAHPGSVRAIEGVVRDFRPETLDGSVTQWTREQVAAAHRTGVQVWSTIHPNSTMNRASGRPSSWESTPFKPTIPPAS